MYESASGPPVPWPYLLDEGRDIFGWGFAFQPRRPGGALSQPMRRAYSETELREQSRDLGRALPAVHSVAVDARGEEQRLKRSAYVSFGANCRGLAGPVHTLSPLTRATNDPIASK
jgi:aminoglycoside phosphotransferase (APT) family kinase protein